VSVGALQVDEAVAPLGHVKVGQERKRDSDEHLQALPIRLHEGVHREPVGDVVRRGSRSAERGTGDEAGEQSGQAYDSLLSRSSFTYSGRCHQNFRLAG
jgi:hypothetical protein